MSTAAVHRVRQYRERLRAGRQVLQVECDEFAVTDFLISTGDLKSSDDTDDRAVVSRALAKWIDKIVKGKL